MFITRRSSIMEAISASYTMAQSSSRNRGRVVLRVVRLRCEHSRRHLAGHPKALTPACLRMAAPADDRKPAASVAPASPASHPPTPDHQSMPASGHPKATCHSHRLAVRRRFELARRHPAARRTSVIPAHPLAASGADSEVACGRLRRRECRRLDLGLCWSTSVPAGDRRPAQLAVVAASAALASGRRGTPLAPDGRWPQHLRWPPACGTRFAMPLAPQSVAVPSSALQAA